MASGSPRVREEGEESTHHPVLQHRPDPGPTSCGGGTARSWPERGRLGDAEAVGHQSRLRKGNFQPKVHLKHLAEKLKLLGLEGDGEEKEHLCWWRKRASAFEGDAKASDSSRGAPRARGGPTTADVEESAQEDKDQIRSDLEKLKKQREEILELKRSGERQRRDYLTQTEVERQKIVSEFRQLRRFLKDQELVLLARLGELDREMRRRQEEEGTKMSGEVSLLDVLICEMEKELEQPASRFLQDARSTADRWETGSAQRTSETFSDLERRLRVISRQNCVLQETLGRFRAFVTLDPDTRQRPAPPIPGPAGGEMDGRRAGFAPHHPATLRCLLLRAGLPGLHPGEPLLGGGGGPRQDLGLGRGPTLRAQEGLDSVSTREGDLGDGALQEPVPAPSRPPSPPSPPLGKQGGCGWLWTTEGGKWHFTSPSVSPLSLRSKKPRLGGRASSLSSGWGEAPTSASAH
ncbi:unnamed protein product, partial [Bubo scandiacus]